VIWHHNTHTIIDTHVYDIQFHGGHGESYSTNNNTTKHVLNDHKNGGNALRAYDLYITNYEGLHLTRMT
jgi:thymidylate synthase